MLMLHSRLISALALGSRLYCLLARCWIVGPWCSPWDKSKIIVEASLLPLLLSCEVLTEQRVHVLAIYSQLLLMLLVPPCFSLQNVLLAVVLY